MNHEHRHGHDHDHSHDHDHDHSHDYDASALAATDTGNVASHAADGLRASAAGKRILYFDAFAGAAGDMIIAGFLDLGVPLAVVQQAVTALGLGAVSITAVPKAVGAIGALSFRVEEGGVHPQRSYPAIRQLIQDAELLQPVKELALRIFARLAAAESRVHRVPVDAVHFHEVGAVDSIVDIVGAATCIHFVGAELWSSPLPLGRGFVKCQHGIIPLPAPATLECLRGAPTVPSGLDQELVTPTGAAIIAEVVTHWCDWPGGSVAAVGWGAGTRVLPDRPNALRLVLLERAVSETSADGTHEILETNLDDLTGELLAHTIQQALAAGANDAWAAPVTMKKGRPGWTLCVLVTKARAAELAQLLLRETSAIGLRHTAVRRTELVRSMVEVETAWGSVPVKVSGVRGSAEHHAKPEFEACRRLAEQHQVPLRQVMQAAFDAIALELR